MTTHTQTGPVISTRGLTRHFTARKQTVEAVKGLDLDIAQGELVAFLGPNGAGKSTTLRMLTTLLAPTSGTATVAGHDVVTEQRAVRRSIGYVGQGNGAGHQQFGRDELSSQARAHGLSRSEARQRSAELIDAFDLSACADRKVSTLSGGQRRRLDIALGLVHLPRVLFLDEPSTGLDPQNRANLQGQIRSLHQETGSTIVLTTHYLEEADALADRVIVIDHGRGIADDTAYQLKTALGDLVTLGFDDPIAAEQAGHRARRLGDRAHVLVTGDEVTIRVPNGRELAPGLVADLAGAGTRVHRMEVVGPTLDDVFLQLTGRSLREDTPDVDVPADAQQTSTETQEVAA